MISLLIKLKTSPENKMQLVLDLELFSVKIESSKEKLNHLFYEKKN